jgi:hypothetical protein
MNIAANLTEYAVRILLEGFSAKSDGSREFAQWSSLRSVNNNFEFPSGDWP